MRIITREEAEQTINEKQAVITEKMDTEYGTHELDVIMAECAIWHRILKFIEDGHMVTMDDEERILVTKNPLTMQ